MTRVVSVHEYELAPDADPADFEAAVEAAERRGLFDLPGLVDRRFLRGIKGDREGEYAAIWTYEDREAWEALWGPPGDPKPPEAYPERWREWEALLDPLLTDDPDFIGFTSYEALA
ncbi:hypothetical protein ACFQPA_05695 [Halomarina halobia]|uniref:Antibiotic biosynthesis monooxygenase n=1 Tax=Halomarina halobia TaxID=3033386 RepID=A0ABD6A7G7_9EURY|nr:hypothetical protein [Halomarina sp. PSR21]